jgi:ABC-2 type transport system permease protein
MSTATLIAPAAEAAPLGGRLDTIIPATERHLTSRVSLRRTLSDTMTMAWRHLVKMLRTPEQFADVFFMPLVFTLMFTFIFGGAIAGNIDTYLPFFIPGMMVQCVISMSVVTGTQLREDMDKGVFDRFKSLPLARIAPLSGALVADTIRYALAAVFTLIVGITIGYRPQGGLIGIVAAALLAIVVSWAVSWIFALLGVLARSAAAVNGISMFLIMPLTFLSNIFVPVETMPTWLQAFDHVNPVSYLVTAARDLTTTGHWGIEVIWSLVGAAVIVAIFAPLTLRAYKRRV